MHLYVHRSTIYNSEDKVNNLNVYQQIDKEHVVYIKWNITQS